MVNIQAGDVIFQKSYGLVSRFIRLLISIRYGVPFKYAWSHVFLAVSESEGVSAEPSGVELIPVRGTKSIINSDAEVYRFAQPLDGDQLAAIKKTTADLAGKGYGYFRYALDFLRVGLFYFLLLGVVPAAIFYKVVGVYFLAAVGVMLVLEKVIGIFDKKTYDCVELVSAILSKCGLWVPLAFRSRSEFPDGMKQAFDTMALHGVARRIAVKRIGEDF